MYKCTYNIIENIYNGSMQSLPIELFAKICENMQLSDTLSVSATCRSLHRVRQNGYIPNITLYATETKTPHPRRISGRATSIRARRCGTRSLIAILAGYADRVSHLHLRKVMVPNINIVSPCANLQVLNISCMDIYSVAALATCKHLRVFKANSTPIDDITALSNLPRLHTVLMDNSALASLPKLAALQTLSIQHTAVADIANLVHSVGLHDVNIAHTEVLDLASLAKLPLQRLKHSAPAPSADSFANTTLAKLAVVGSQLSPLPLYSIRALRVCKLLQILRVTGALITDIGTLVECPLIHKLDISHTRVSTVPVLPRLRKLVAVGCPLTDLQNIGSATGLVHLDVSMTGVQSLAGLEPCTRLATLVVSNNQVTTVCALRGMRDLAYCDISHNHCRDFSPMAECPAITHLDISSNPVNTLAAFAGLANLETLKAGCTNISDLKPLHRCARLAYLDINWTVVYDLAPLQLLDIRTLLVRGCPIADHTISDHIYNKRW